MRSLGPGEVPAADAEACELPFSLKVFPSHVRFKDFIARGTHQTPPYGRANTGVAVPWAVLVSFLVFHDARHLEQHGVRVSDLWLGFICLPGKFENGRK